MSPYGRQSFAPHRSAIHSVPSGATSTMLIEPSVRPAGAVIQAVWVRYGFGGTPLLLQAVTSAAAAVTSNHDFGMTAESARGAGAVQGSRRA